VQNFRELKVWQKAHSLTLDVYFATRRFPATEQYGLTSQLRRSSVSVGSNLAEGCGRGSDSDFARFCQIAMGSACEVEYQLLLAQELNYLASDEHERLAEQVQEVKRMLTALLNRLRPTKTC
jgi:four helix bundle protein